MHLLSESWLAKVTGSQAANTSKAANVSLWYTTTCVDLPVSPSLVDHQYATGCSMLVSWCSCGIMWTLLQTILYAALSLEA